MSVAEDEKVSAREVNEALERIYIDVSHDREVIYRGARFRSCQAEGSVAWRFEGWVAGFQRID